MTRKLKSRGLDLGVGSSDQVSAKTFLAGFTPVNFTPSQIDTEGTTKVSALLKGIDDRFGQLSASFVEELFTANGSTSRFSLAADIAANTKIDVFFNGVLQEETVDWDRDHSNNQIVYLNDSAVEANAPNATRLRIRIYTNNSLYIDQSFNGPGPWIISQTIDNSSKIDVYFNGALKEETEDWTRDVSLNRIVAVTDPTNSSTRIRIRVWL